MTTRVGTDVRFGAGVSGNSSVSMAAAQACAQCAEPLGTNAPDLVLMFFTAHHAENAPFLAEYVMKKLAPRCLVGVSAESVLGGQVEIEQRPGISMLAGVMPGAEFKPFNGTTLTPVDDSAEGLDRLTATLGITDHLRAVLFFADPYSTPMFKLLPALNRVMARSLPRERDPAERAKLFGGLASSARAPGANRLILNDRVFAAGGAGVAISGNVRIDTVVSQGCRAFGPTFVVTKARGNIISELGGRPALEVIQHEVLDLPDEAKERVDKGGLFVGRATSEYRERFGRGDFVIRNVTGADPGAGAVAVNDLVRVGQTVQLHYRDAVTASEDLALMLDAQKLHERPGGALVVTCNGRGSRLFPAPNHDTGAIVRAFAPQPAGESRAKAGAPIDPADKVGGPHPLPVAGFFAAGELCPVGGEAFLHGQSAAVALFRNA